MRRALQHPWYPLTPSHSVLRRDRTVHTCKHITSRRIERPAAEAIEGEARDIALMHAAMTRQVVKRGQPFAKPCVIISGGETTVTVRGNGRGGRNAEFLLSFAIAMDGLQGVYAIACDTDGIDGSEDNAGAVYLPDSLARAGEKGIRARKMLENNDGYGFFSALGDLVVTGPSRTNVNDFRAILIV